MSRLLIVCLLGLFAVLPGCSSSPSVLYDADPMTDFGKYRGFNWLPAAGAEIPHYDTRIKRFVALDLTQRGYLQGGAPPALLISYQLTLVGDKGTLGFEMVDSESSRFVWNASTAISLPTDLTPQQVDERVQETVTMLLSYFPPPPPDK